MTSTSRLKQVVQYHPCSFFRRKHLKNQRPDEDSNLKTTCFQVKHLLRLRGCNCRLPAAGSLQLRREPRTSLMVALPSREMETLMESWCCAEKIGKSLLWGHHKWHGWKTYLERQSNKYQRKYSINVITLAKFNMGPRWWFPEGISYSRGVIFRFLVILWEGICEHLQHGTLWRNKHSHLQWSKPLRHSMKSIEILVS